MIGFVKGFWRSEALRNRSNYRLYFYSRDVALRKVTLHEVLPRDIALRDITLGEDSLRYIVPSYRVEVPSTTSLTSDQQERQW